MACFCRLDVLTEQYCSYYLLIPSGMTDTNNIEDFGDHIGDIANPIVNEVEHMPVTYDDVIKWKHLPRYWPFVRGIHRWPVDSPHKGQGRGAFDVSLISARTNGWANNRDVGDLRCRRPHYDVIIMIKKYMDIHYSLIALTYWEQNNFE